ncbi:hypothetical protein Sta7437_1069 [Stanieria cyanosphaera PCC 7437]|uniref:HAD-superfamily hydrolase, subfamily IA, variant 1 n=2 Tax=Stanieria cyanosphaera TaxID=102116 RepID=K9XSJ9_STAC7|nr:hypothetical protein Sta7437_1069 [Stanieria cyanosphaera PCC 7437]
MHQANKKVIYISDMYYSSDIIKYFLKQKYIWKSEDIIYVSSEERVNKASGNLFKECLDQLSLKPSQICHIGDNLHSDVKIPNKLGIKAQAFTYTHLNRYEQKISNNTEPPLKFRSLLAGTCRLTRLQSQEKIFHNQIIWDTASNVIAPVLFGFVYWCLSQAQKKGIQRLYFVARDGQILLKIAHIICKNWGYTIDCRYLYGSRQAWHFPAIQEIGQFELDWIFDPTEFLSVYSVCERVNVNPEEIENILEHYNFERSIWNKNLTEEQRYFLKKVFENEQIKNLILNKALQFRQITLNYFEQEGVFDDIPFAIIDIGWNGRLQKSLSQLLSVANRYPLDGINGFYFSLSKRIKPFSKDNLFVYFADTNLNPERNFVFLYKGVLELFVNADHGSTIRFEKIQEKYIPILRGNKNEKAIQWGLYILQKAVIFFAEQLVRILEENQIKEEYILNISNLLLKEFLLSPSYWEASVFGSFQITEDQTENIFYELAPKYNLFNTLRLILYNKHIHHNVWFPASKIRSSIICTILLNQIGKGIKTKIKQKLKPINFMKK